MRMIEHPLAGPVIRLVHSDDEALVAPLGAQVVAWRHRGRDMLWCTKTRLDDKPLRGGIPVCWPWFGAHPHDREKPMHGIARTSGWEIASAEAHAVTLRLRHGALDARVDVTLTDTLRVSLTTRNEGLAAVVLTAALHTYLAVDDIAGVRVTGLDGAGYLDKVDAGARKIQRGDVSVVTETDRIYAAGRATLHDGTRTVDVDGAGTSGSLVVWNPWIDKSAQLADTAPDDYRRMLCLETAWAADDARVLAPGASATLTTILRAGAAA